MQAILTKVFRDLLRSFQANVDIVPRLAHNCSLPSSFQFLNNPTIKLFSVDINCTIKNPNLIGIGFDAMRWLF
jgi:hypothetical protein